MHTADHQCNVPVTGVYKNPKLLKRSNIDRSELQSRFSGSAPCTLYGQLDCTVWIFSLTLSLYNTLGLLGYISAIGCL